MPTNTSSRGYRTLAVCAVATAGGLLFAGPARSAVPEHPAGLEPGTVTYSGSVSCAGKFPNTVPTRVTLRALGSSVSDGVDSQSQPNAPYGPVDLVVPVNTNFKLAVTVTCTIPGGSSHQYHLKINQHDLSDDDTITLNLP
ncbi:hypothetical protein [Streptomyces cyanogenus]|uniref:Secreted protein n=1 Tax=Streptomyces cyanogenus TaxID=80860 RepID=A0ABX7TZF4_STRCY|nr:hypothetical protein [Streptomyces cyanogenus]QTE01084.1 hypothetical protein S1361_27375 [Streptomyces cyanogenus]